MHGIEKAEDVVQHKHNMHILAHENQYGAKLGELKNPPTQEQLDKDFEDRRANGELFTQQKENQ